MGKMRRKKILITTGVVIAALLLLLAALPLWFPWILKPVLKNRDVRYSRYDRQGYNQFILHDVKFSNATTTFTAGQVEVLLPATWLWRKFSENTRENFLRVADWELTISGATKTNKQSGGSVYKTLEKLHPLLVDLNRWLPKASLTNGTINLRDREILLPFAIWNNGTLAGNISVPKILPKTFLNARLAGTAAKTISFQIANWNLNGEILARVEKEKLLLGGEAFWQSNRLDVSAEFGPRDFLPEIASAKSKSFRVPATILKLEGYRDLEGALNFRWETNRFALDATASAAPIESKEIFLSPVDAVVHASGNTNFFRIEQANIYSPWLRLNLSSNVDFNFHGEMLSPSAALNVSADLSRQKWIAANGFLEGNAVLRRGTNRFPDATFQLSGTNVAVREIRTEQFAIHGKFDWPSLSINPARIQFKEGATAEATFQFNAVSRSISEGKLILNGQLGSQFLPSKIFYKNISLTAEFDGPLKKLSHSAHLELQDVKLPQLAPLGIVATWSGTQLSLKNFQAKISAENSSLAIAGSGSAQTNFYSAQFQQFIFTTNGQSVLKLEKPFAISLAKQQTNWSFDISPTHLGGTNCDLALDGKIIWPSQGNFAASVQRFDFSVLRDFLERPPLSAFIEKINFFANWTNGPLTFGLDGLARFFSEDGTPFTAELKTSGDANGVLIERAAVESQSQSVISGKGFLPVKLDPARSNVVEFLPQQRIDFHASTTTNSQVWERIAAWTHTSFRDPVAQISVSGTFDAPEGNVTLRAREILLKPQKPDQPMPRFQNLAADFDLVRDKIALNLFEVFVEGQPVTMTGELPLPKNLQSNWKKVFDWRKANAHLKIADAQIAAFTRLFPDFLSPLGTVNLDATAKAGRLDGELRVTGAGLRPIPSLGPVHDIDARLKLAGDLVQLETFKGFIGGQPVDLSGEINLAKSESATRLPFFNFQLRGTNVPLTRQPEFILRSDIDLNIGNQKGGEPLVSGALNLRESFFLSDLSVLVPGKVAKPRQRPPYFSVETEPFAKWRLAVSVKGNNFLRVRSPIFRGELSANLKIEGTLKEPSALGDVRINSGVVQFPFANLRVDQGYVSLTSENPYLPQLSVTASSRTFGYDVKMLVSGPADKPKIEFTSNPGLTSEQILLMVTAGELPRDEISFSTQQKAGRLAFFLGKNLFSKFGSSSAMDDKLEIRSGEDVSEQGRQTYYLQYKLTDDWSIYGEYDRFGGVNAGVKWKFFSK